MFLRGCLLCLFYFSLIQGHMALPRDKLLGLSHKDSTLCHLVASNSSARFLTFLAQLGGSHNETVLFQTRWSWQGDLEQCLIWQEESITKAYLAFCLEKWDQPQSSGTFLRARDSQLERDLRDLEEWGGKCSSPFTSPAAAGPESSRRLPRGRRSAWPARLGTRYPGTRSSIAAAADRHRGARRSRRGLTLPGTMWCGAGDSAENFTDLGAFSQTDLCCREHDHCEHQISAFEYRYGMVNLRLHTISHCDCDYRFRRCLLNVNNTISRLVGITFFSILQAPCFDLELVEHCVKKTRWNHCNVTELVPQAILHSQSKYNYNQPISGSKPTSSPTTTGRQNQTATSLNLLPNPIQRKKIENNKTCQKCTHDHRGQKTKVISENTLKMKANMTSTMVHNETDFSPVHRQNLMKNLFPVELKEKNVSRKLLQRNASNAVNSQGDGSTVTGWDENISKEHGVTILGQLSTTSSLPKSTASTLLLSQNGTLPLIRLGKNIVKNNVDSFFSIPSRKKFNLSRFSKNKSSNSLPNHMDRKGLTPINPECGIGNWSHSGIIGGSSCVHQSLDPIQLHQTKTKDNSRSCNRYKSLDQCEHTISPQEFKFSYDNQEHKILYHCNCTKRLAEQMKKKVNVNTVEDLLLEFVSPNCFRLKSVLGNCSKEEQGPCEKHSTVAVLSKSRHLQKILKARRTVDKSLYPLTKRQERNKNETSIGTDSVKLYNKCLQMIQALTIKA